MMTARLLLLLAAIACHTPSGPPAVISGHELPPTTASCPITTPARTKVTGLAFRAWLGKVGDRSWVMADRGEHTLELVTLGGDGRLAEVRLPIHLPANLWWQVDGAHLWIEVGRATPQWYDVDLAAVTPAAHLDPSVEARALGGASGFAIDTTRALFYSFAISPPGPGFELWDRERRKTLAVVPQAIVGIDEPPMRCVRDHCFALVVLGDGPTRRLTVFRFAPDGTLTKIQLADDHLGDFLFVPDGDHSYVIWSSYSRPGLFERTLDESGQPIDAEVMLAAEGRDPAVIAGEPRLLAYSAGDHWHLASLAPDGRAFAHEMVLPLTGSFLTAAPASGGMLAIGFDSDVSPDAVVPPTKAGAVFVPTGGTPPKPLDVMFGEKHTSWVPFPLVSPGNVAVLLLQQGYGPQEGEVVTLRVPCQ